MLDRKPQFLCDCHVLLHYLGVSSNVEQDRASRQCRQRSGRSEGGGGARAQRVQGSATRWRAVGRQDFVAGARGVLCHTTEGSCRSQPADRRSRQDPRLKGGQVLSELLVEGVPEQERWDCQEEGGPRPEGFVEEDVAFEGNSHP